MIDFVIVTKCPTAANESGPTATHNPVDGTESSFIQYN
jgi:hypothetical protein